MNKFINSDLIIRRIENATGFQRKEIAENIFNISKNNLSNRIRENRLDLYTLSSWAVNNGINLEWLFRGHGSPQESDSGLMQEIDVEVLSGVIKSVDDYLQKAEIDLKPDSKARLIALLYDRFAGNSGAVNEKIIMNYLKLMT